MNLKIGVQIGGMGRSYGAVSAYAAYALAERFTVPEYWVGGTQYGNPSGPTEMVGDPGFATPAYWSVDAGVTISGGKANWSATVATSQAYKGSVLSVGASYVCTFTIDSISAGGVTVNCGGTLGTTRNAPGTYTETLIAVSPTLGLMSQGASTTAVCDNFSIKAVGVAALPGYSFTRSGTQGAVDASGAVQWFGPQVPAINSAGYHAYGAVTNLILQSQDLTSASWTKLNSTATANTAVAPDGTTTTDKITTTASPAYVYQTIVVVASTTRTASWFVPKTGGGFPYAYIYISDNVANAGVLTLTVATGVLGTPTITAGAGISMTGYVVDAGSYWRLVVVWVTTANLSPAVGFGGSNTINSLTITTNGDQSGWQFQDLLGNFPDGGPLITTTTAALGIGASVLTNSIAIADVDQLIYATFIVPAVAVSNYIFSLQNAGGTAYIAPYVTSALAVQVQISGSFNNTSASFAPGSKVTVVVKREGGNWRGGTIQAGVLTWIAAAVAGAVPAGITLQYSAGGFGGFPLESKETGIFIKPGTFNTDALVLAAVAEGSPFGPSDYALYESFVS